MTFCLVLFALLITVCTWEEVPPSLVLRVLQSGGIPGGKFCCRYVPRLQRAEEDEADLHAMARSVARVAAQEASCEASRGEGRGDGGDTTKSEHHRSGLKILIKNIFVSIS